MLNTLLPTNQILASFIQWSEKMIKTGIVFILLFGSLSGKAQTVLYSADFEEGPALPAGWTVTAGTAPGFASDNVNTSSTYTDPTPSGGYNLLADDNASLTPFEYQEIVLNTGSLSTVGYANIQVIWGGMASAGAAFPGLTFEYSTDGGGVWNPVTFNDDPLLASDGTWYAITEVTLPADAEGVANIQFRFSFTAVNSGDVYAIDDFRVQGQGVNLFYYDGSGDLDVLTNWGDQTDGLGANPANFTDDGKTYNIRNNAAATIGAAWTVSGAGSKVVVEAFTPTNFTIPSGFTFTGTVDVESGATLTINRTTIPTLGTLGATSTVVYGASSAQTVTSATYGNLTISSGGAITHVLGGNVTVSAALNIVGTTKLGIGANTLTLDGTITGTGTVTGGATSNMSIGGTGTLGTLTFTTGALPHTLNNFTVNRTSTGIVTLGVGSVTINGALSLNDGTLNTNGGMSMLGSVSQTTGTISFTAGTPLVGYNQTSNGQYVAFGNYGALFFNGFNKTFASSGTIAIAGAFTNGAGTHTTTGSTVNYNGTVAQTIRAINYDNLTISSARAANSVTLTSGATIGVAGIFNPTATFTTGNYIVTGNTVDFNGSVSQTIPAFNYNNLTVSNTNAIVLAAAGTIGIGTTTGTFTPGSAAYTITGSTIDFRGTAAQTVPAFNYNNLTISNARTTNSVTLANAGTIGVAGTFNPSATFTTGAYIITTSTIDFNGSGGQGIPAFLYNNLTSSSTGARTLAAAGTIGVAGTFTPGANVYTNTGSTIDFNGTVAQGIPAFNYNHLTSSSTGGRTLAAVGTIGIAGTFTPFTNIYTITGSTVNFNGTGGAQSIPAFSFNNLQQNNVAGTSLAGNIDMTGICTIGSGTLTNAGFTFTLLSTAGATASIDEIPPGAGITGNITMQRFAPASLVNNDWRFLGAPVDDAVVTLADWGDDFATSGFPGSDCGPTDCGTCGPSCTYPSIYWYDETPTGDLDAFGFTEPTDISDPIVQGRGYWVYIGPTPTTFEVTGEPYQQSIPLPVSCNLVAYDDDNDGWNLVANPYPCTIDWDDAGWTKTNMGTQFHIYNSATGNYSDWTTGVGAGVNGGSQYIPSSQSFWVKANGGGAPALTVTEQCKIATQNQTFYKMAPALNTSPFPMAFKDFPIPQASNSVPGVLRLTAKGNGRADEMLIAFKQGATNNYDTNFDSDKLINPAPEVHNFSSVMNGEDYSINALPPITGNVSIPIRLTIPSCTCSPTFSISRDSILMLPASSCIVLEDTKTGSMIDLRAVVTYTFTISDTTSAPRFILHISAPVTKSAASVSCAGGSNGKASAKGTGTGPWTYTWKNSAGTLVKSTFGSTTADTLYNCDADIYSVTISGGTCGPVTDTIHVSEPYMVTGMPSSVSASCFAGNNGSASVIASGGTGSYSYLWQGGQSTSAASNLSSGNYSVTITDSKGCTATTSVTVGQPSAITSTVSPTHVSCNGSNNGIASIAPAGGTPGYSYAWSTGATVSQISNLSPQVYTVTVTDSQGCTGTASVSITQPAVLTNTVTGTDPLCYGGNNGSAVASMTGGTSPYSFSWSTGSNNSTAYNLTQGNYSVTITDAKGCTSAGSVVISEPAAIVTGFTVSSDTVDLALGSNVTFTNTSVGGTTYQWSFGDGSPIATSMNPNHTYTATGTFNVVLIATSSPCSKGETGTIVVINSNPTAVTGSDYSSQVNVGYENGDVYLMFSFSTAKQVAISVYNMMGQEILVLPRQIVKDEKIKLDFPPASIGVYIAVSEMSNAVVSKKILIPVR